MIKEVIKDYFGRVDLKNKIINAYTDALQADIKMKKDIMANPKWSTPDNDYHRELRRDMENDVLEMENQLRILNVNYRPSKKHKHEI